MACSSTDAPEGGFATAAATMVSLALAVVAAASVAASTAALRLARADLARTQAEYALDGAQLRAAVTALSNRKAARLRWTIAGDSGPVQLLAEPQGAKLSLAAAADLGSGVLEAAGASEPEKVKARLRALALARGGELAALPDADLSPRWHSCAASLVSRYGQGKALTLIKAEQPERGPVAWRIGEVWRLRASGAGWVDDRIVRFTGDPAHPAAVVERRFYRGGGESPCDTLATAKRT